MLLNNPQRAAQIKLPYRSFIRAVPRCPHKVLTHRSQRSRDRMWQSMSDLAGTMRQRRTRLSLTLTLALAPYLIVS